MHSEGMQGHSKEPRIPREASKEDKEAEDEPAEGAISLAQLKIGRSYGKVLFKKFFIENGRMVERRGTRPGGGNKCKSADKGTCCIEELAGRCTEAWNTHRLCPLNSLPSYIITLTLTQDI